MQIQSISSSTSLRIPQKSIAASMQPQISMKAKIRDDLKAGGTLVKKFNAVLTETGIKINLVR